LCHTSISTESKFNNFPSIFVQFVIIIFVVQHLHFRAKAGRSPPGFSNGHVADEDPRMNAFNVDMELGVGEVTMFMCLRAGILSDAPAGDPPTYAAVAASNYLPDPESSSSTVHFYPTPTRSTATTTLNGTRSGPATSSTERQLPQTPKVNGSVKFGVELGFKSGRG